MQTDVNRVAAVQMASGSNVSANLGEAARLIERAAAEGARLVVLPENFASMGMAERDKLSLAEVDGEGPVQAFLAGQAERHGVWLVGGTIAIKGDDPERVRAACLLYDDQGARVARYDKIHLFDVRLSDSESYRESATLEPGSTPVVVDTPVGRLGLAVCYDLRFPELFRRMAGLGMEVLALPSAFTAGTGEAHWRVLVRARAIENQCYVVAADQGGYHVNGRETHGDSMIVDPWGVVLDSLARGSGVVAADISRERLMAVRSRLPALQHRRI